MDEDYLFAPSVASLAPFIIGQSAIEPLPECMCCIMCFIIASRVVA